MISASAIFSVSQVSVKAIKSGLAESIARDRARRLSYASILRTLKIVTEMHDTSVCSHAVLWSVSDSMFTTSPSLSSFSDRILSASLGIPDSMSSRRFFRIAFSMTISG